MKPVNLNQLLFHTKSDSLSFFLSPEIESHDLNSVEKFLEDMVSQLKIQEMTELECLLDKNKTLVKKILKDHPDKSHGFFLAADLQGYLVLDQRVESYCMIGQTFHVRPILEELFENPEFMLVNISLFDVKIYKGDFQNLEIIQQYEFDQLPANFTVSRIYAPQHMGLIPYKTILAIKTIAQKTSDYVLYQSMPVVVTGLEEMKVLFLRYFEETNDVISHFQEDFYEKTCAEILGKCKIFRPAIMDFYSARLKERIKRLMKSKRIIADLGEIIKATYSGRVVHLVLPVEKKIWGKFNPETGEYVIHKKIGKTSVDIINELAEEVMCQGGRIQILRPQFFPQNSVVLAVLKGQV